jgi:hypothetical protein
MHIGQINRTRTLRSWPKIIRVRENNKPPATEHEEGMMPGARIRYAIDPRDIPAEKVARRLHLTLSEFLSLTQRLFARGFPHPDPDTGNFDSVAIERWMDARSGLSTAGDIMPPNAPRNAQEVFGVRARRLLDG